MPVTTTPLHDPGDPERKWHRLSGVDRGTGCEFNDDVFGVHADGTILNAEGEPLVESDWETIAVRNSLGKLKKEF